MILTSFGTFTPLSCVWFFIRAPGVEGMKGVGTNDPGSTSQLSATYHGLPTPLTSTARNFPNPTTESSPPVSPMSDTFSSAKGKGKRPAEDIEPCSATQAIQPPHRLNGPQVVRRHQHRRRNVAATIWGPQLPTQACVPGQPFNIYKAILRHPNLFFQFAIRLPPPSIIDLYAIDKEFHYRFNKYSTSIIHDYASYHAPQAAFIFSWVLFPELCISDPMLKPMDGRPHLARDIPSLRWTKMVIYRDAMVHALLAELGLEGHRVPQQTHTTLMKCWLLMEMKTISMRNAFLSDRNVWTDFDIICFHLFVVKLDMRFSDPVVGNGLCALSHLLLSQKSLSSLVKVLLGKKVLDYDDVAEMMVRTYLMEDFDLDTHPWLDDEIDNGVPEDEWALLSRDGWDVDGERMEPAVDMVLMEGFRRGIPLQQYLLDFVLYGFVDFDTGENIPAARRFRSEFKMVLPKTAWPNEERRRSIIARLDRRLGVETKIAPTVLRHMRPDPGLAGGNFEYEVRDSVVVGATVAGN